ncbi:MAG: OmpA family protein [Deltaproteobacteria bacterium]|nr:OmpA family protein [Deltaproteobacteria bacterium]
MRARELGWVVAAGLVYGGAAARARADDGGYQLDHYEPTPAGDPFLIVEAPWYAPTRGWAAGLTLDYAHDLVAAQGRDPNGLPIDQPSPIAHAGTAHLDVAIAIGARIALSATVPLLLDQQGTAFAGVGPSGTAAGDPRLGARARLLGGSGAALDASIYGWIPVGAEGSYAGDASARGMARLTASGTSASLRWAVNASFLARKTAVLSTLTAPVGITVGSEVQVAAAASYLALDQRLSLGPELIASIGVADLPAPQDRTTIELVGSARYQIDDRFALGLGAGTTLAGGPAPDARLFLSFAYAPSAPRGSRFERVIVLPDEDGHVGAVEVQSNDGKTRTLLDKAYASSEVSRKVTAVRPVQSSPEALPPAAAALAQSLPPKDGDADGVPDASDACPDRAGVASPDPIRTGCPASVEKVVVLPDEDGHVGGVEVDDGHGVTVLDHAYASTEVGTDGRVATAPPATQKVVDRSIAPVARALPAPDADDDGIHDLDDACPERAGAASSDPLRNGCPASAERVVVLPDFDGHVGGVEVDDGHGVTVLDHAYAAAETAADGVTTSVAPTTQVRSVDRAVAALARAMPIVDSDGDGVRDERDACPERAGVASTDALRDGCPPAEEKVVILPDADGHVGGVEVQASDGTTVVLDVAYASTEVSGGKVALLPAATPVALVRATTAIGKAMPISDRDDDGVADGEDACPDRAGLAGPAPRNGCPRTVEQVVVLPDENGAVGAVEVQPIDGSPVTLLDKEYASAEIGTDGKTHAMPGDATEVSARYAAALAARPAGARIILYFTAGSAPVRDLTGPLDNLVAEVKAKGTYDIDVIGHTDQTGSERANVKIGKQRAQVIADRLIAAGIPADRVHVTSKGSSEPAVKRRSRRTVELRNRRVEIWVR